MYRFTMKPCRGTVGVVMGVLGVHPNIAMRNQLTVGPVVAEIWPFL